MTTDRTKLAMDTTTTPIQISIDVHNQTFDVVEQEKICDGPLLQSFMFSENVKRSSRFMILLVCIVFLIIGRYSVPDDELTNIQDQIMDLLKFANDFINADGNQFYRNLLQICCSLLVDLVFLITFGYWVLRGTNARLPLSLALFYITRALVQKMWSSPFPEGFYWDSPGFPSLVVPYGRGSDFFFSGHSGFLVICACEWNKIRMTKVRNFIILVAVYTIFILLTYRIHYSIDVFTGVFFSEWCFGKVDLYIGSIEGVCRKVITKVQHRFFFFEKTAKIASLDQVPQEQEPYTV